MRMVSGTLPARGSLCGMPSAGDPVVAMERAFHGWHHDELVTESWTSRHFSLANPVTGDVTDLPLLLRCVADQIEACGITPMELLDVVVHQEITADGPSWSVNVYWSPDGSEAGWAPRHFGRPPQPPRGAAQP